MAHTRKKKEYKWRWYVSSHGLARDILKEPDADLKVTQYGKGKKFRRLVLDRDW